MRKYGPCGGSGLVREPVEHRPEVPPSQLERAVSKIGDSILRQAAVGLACGTFPTACPAFVAINRAAGLAKTAKDVYDAFAQASDRAEGIKDATKEAGKEIVSTSI